MWLRLRPPATPRGARPLFCSLVADSVPRVGIGHSLVGSSRWQRATPPTQIWCSSSFVRSLLRPRPAASRLSPPAAHLGRPPTRPLPPTPQLRLSRWALVAAWPPPDPHLQRPRPRSARHRAVRRLLAVVRCYGQARLPTACRPVRRRPQSRRRSGQQRPPHSGRCVAVDIAYIPAQRCRMSTRAVRHSPLTPSRFAASSVCLLRPSLDHWSSVGVMGATHGRCSVRLRAITRAPAHVVPNSLRPLQTRPSPCQLLSDRFCFQPAMDGRCTWERPPRRTQA